MKEIVPGIWTWSVFNDEKQINFNGWYVSRTSEPIIVDPPRMSGENIDFIRSHGRPVAVILTNKHHTRESAAVCDLFDAPIWVHEKDRSLMELETQRTYKDDENLPGGLRVITLENSKTPGESALLVSGEPSALIIGDAMIGKPKGGLSMLPDEKFKDPQAARAGLGKLLDVEFDALLLGDGESILSGAKQKLKAYLA